MTVQGLGHFQQLLTKYKKCAVPNLDNPQAVVTASNIFTEIMAIDRQVIAGEFSGTPGVAKLVKEIDGAQLFAHPFLSVFEAAFVVLNASVIPSTEEELQPSIDKLTRSGLEGIQSEEWKAFYQSVLDRLLKAAPQNEQSEKLDDAVDNQPEESEAVEDPKEDAAQVAAQEKEAQEKQVEEEEDQKEAVQEVAGQEKSDEPPLEESFSMVSITRPPEETETHHEIKTIQAGSVVIVEKSSLQENSYALAEWIYSKEGDYNSKKQDYNKVVELLSEPEGFLPWLLLARALTKLGKYKEAQNAFGEANNLSRTADEAHLLLDRRAWAYLEWYKATKDPNQKRVCSEGCLTCLIDAQQYGRLPFFAGVAHDASILIEDQCWKEMINGGLQIHLLMWRCAAILSADSRTRLDLVWNNMMWKFPPSSVAKLLKKDVDALLASKQAIDLPLAILIGWRLLEGRSISWNIENGRALYNRLRAAALSLQTDGLDFLFSLCARAAWNIGIKVGFANESTISYAAALVRIGDYGALYDLDRVQRQGKEGGEKPLRYLLAAFCDHHRLGHPESPLVTRASVKETFGKARELFDEVRKEPYWRAILQQYFPA